MKYEYLKGSEKDFDYCHDDVIAIYGTNNAGKFYATKSSSIINSWHLIAERRPVTEPVWLVGKLPPVGTKVDIISDIGDSIVFEGSLTGEVIAHVEDNAVVRMAWGLACFKVDRLLPSRSPEDVARDEFGAAVAGYLDVRPNGVRMSELYNAIAAGKIPGITLSGK